jgi:hypothetical protein
VSSSSALASSPSAIDVYLDDERFVAPSRAVFDRLGPRRTRLRRLPGAKTWVGPEISACVLFRRRYR